MGVAFKATDGTAKAGVDYTASTGIISIGNTSTNSFYISGIGNLKLQDDRTFNGVLTSLVNLADPKFAQKTNISFSDLVSSGDNADFNGDGKPDMVLGMSSTDTVGVLLNTTATGATTATFSPAVGFTAGTGSSTKAVAVGDLNTYGKPDIAVTNLKGTALSSDDLWIYINSTASGATSPNITGREVLGFGTVGTVRVRDINGDGLDDMTVLADNTVYAFRSITAPGASMSWFGTPVQTGVGTGLTDFSIADFNGDGKPDVSFVGGASNPLQVNFNTTPFLDATIGQSTAVGTIVDDDDPYYITAVTGSGQSATIKTTFGTNLNVFVRNAAGGLVQGAVVTYSAPTSGASGTFAGGSPTYSVTSASSAQAPATPFTANGQAGTYTVTASVPGLSSMVHFILTNLKVSPAFSDLHSVSIEYGTDSTTLSGHFAAGQNVPVGRTITISIGSHNATAVVGSNGNFSASIDTASIDASDTRYTVSYVFAGDSTYNTATDTSTTLTIAPRNLSIYANPIIKTYGDTYTFSGDEFLAVGLLGSDSISGLTLVSAGAAASANVSSIPNISGPPYAIVPSEAEGEGLENYHITYVNGGMTVVPRHIQGSFTAADKAYDGSTDATVLTRSTVGDLGGVTLVGGVASFDDPAIGDDKTVRLVGASLGGPGALNYVLDSVLPAKADITSAAEPDQMRISGASAPSPYGQPVPFTASLDFAATGKVTFHDRDKVVGTADLAGGKATISLASLGVGDHWIWASYGGDGGQGLVTSGNYYHAVTRANTVTNVTASPGVSGFGQAVTFTAAVNAGATGDVLFYDGPTPIGRATIGGDAAKFTYTAPQAGSHEIRAIYVGDFNYLASTSPPVTQIVKLVNTSTAISAALTPGSNGQTVTLQASVSPGAAGSVIFFDGSKVLGTGLISGTTATLVTPRSRVTGNGFFRAVYGGDTTYLGSVSGGVSLPATPAGADATPFARLGFIPQFQQMAARFNPRGGRFLFNRR